MKRILKLILIFILSHSLKISAQTNAWQWARSAGGSSIDRARSIAKDQAGNVYVCGDFSSSPFTIGNTTFSLSNIQFDIFVAKYDSLGNLIWAKQFGSSGSDYCNSISCDFLGNVYIGGQFSSSITFGSTTLNGNADVFLTKLDSAGNVIWARRSGGTNAEQIYSVCTDKFGNIFVGGYFKSGVMTFGTTTFTTAGQQDIFIAKYDSSGNALWAKRAGGNLNDVGNSVAADDSGNVYLCGEFASNAISFDGVGLVNTVPWDGFVAKFSASGNVLWVNQIAGGGLEYAESVAVDAASNLYVSGTFSSASLSFGAHTINLADGNIFLLKMNPSGSVIWAKNGGGASSYLFRNSLCLNEKGEAFIGGYFTTASINFSNDTVVNSLPTSGTAEIFVVHYDTSGVVKSLHASGGNKSDEAVAITCASANEYYITGAFSSDSLNYGSNTLYNSGNFDFFIAKSGMPINTGIIEQTTLSVKVYPNPLDENSILELPLQTASNNNYELSVTTLSGEVIYSAMLKGNRIRLNKNNFRNGIYYYSIGQSNRVFARGKFVVNE